MFTNMLPTIEQHVEWIAATLTHMRAEGLSKIETTLDDEDSWMEHANSVVGGIRGQPGCSSWYTGDNVPGKPRVLSVHPQSIHCGVTLCVSHCVCHIVCVTLCLTDCL